MLKASEIRDDLENRLLDGQRVNPQHVNRASQCGSPCVRELYYARAEWKEAAPASKEGLLRMRAGRRYEEWAKQDLMESGYLWHEAQKAGFDEKLLLSAHIEGYVVSVRDPECVKHLAEIKSMSPHVYGRIRSQRDLLEHEFYRRYVYQVTAYMRMMDKDEAIMFIVNRDDGEIRPIPIEYDPAIWNDIVDKCKAVNRAVKKKKPPPRCNDDRGEKAVCRFCKFKTLCLPDILNPTKLTLAQDPEFLAILREWYELKPHRDRWQALDKEIKEMCRDKDGFVVGEFLIEGKKTKAGWKREITKLEGVNDDDETEASDVDRGAADS